MSNSKFIYDLVQKEVESDSLLSVLLESNVDGLSKVLSDDILYHKLIQYLSKYKLLGWQDTFNRIINESDIIYNSGTLAGLISNFDKIVNNIENGATMTSVLDRANCYSSVSREYSILFGVEDFNLIVANEGKNKASMSKYDRLDRCMKLIPHMYRRKVITVPLVEKTFTIDNHKDIGINIGNITSMMNLTYGERTNSCMRAGGAFNHLFEYCIKDNNGFHIRFTNPKTGKFVSRVSGFRNGNTVFLNELRLSNDEEYTNDDLYKALKLVSKYLIEASKDSSLPIDNVLVTSDYALEDYKNEEKNLNLTKEEKKVAFREMTLNFKNSAIIMATSSRSGNIVDYNFTDDVPTYSVVRESIKTYYGKDGIKRMLQLQVLNNVINGLSLDIDDNIKESARYVISGEDFYIAFYQDRKEVYILDIAKENKNTLDEINSIMSSYNNNVEESKSKI